MATPTWKSYGGTQNLPQNNSIFANDITCANLHVKKAYEGTLAINGRLDVSGIFAITGNFVASNATFNYVTVNNDISVNGTMYANQDLEVERNIIAQTRIYLGPPVAGQVSPFFSGASDAFTGIVGLNVITPQATLDILGGALTTLNLKTSAANNRNVVAQNASGLGIAVQTSDAQSAIQFYNNTTINTSYGTGSSTPNIPDAQIQYTASSRNLTLSAPNSTQIQSLLAVSDRVPTTTPIPQIYNEAAIIYDVSNTQTYANNNYSVSSGQIGDALSLVATDASSITFLHTTTPNQKGAQIGGGAYPYDTTRSFGTWGHRAFNTVFGGINGTYFPAQSIVSGNFQNSPLWATTGINTYQPLADSYALDINGPVRIGNGSIITTANLPFQVLSSASYTNTITQKKSILLVGTPSTATYPYIQQVAQSTDEGKSWFITSSNFNTGDITLNPINFNSISINASGTITTEYIVIVGQKNYIFYTTNSANPNGWLPFFLPQPIATISNIQLLSVAATNNSTQNFFFLCTSTPTNAANTLWAIFNSSSYQGFNYSTYNNVKLKVIYDAPNSQWYIHALAYDYTSRTVPNAVITYIYDNTGFRRIYDTTTSSTPTNAQYFDIHIIDLDNVIAVGTSAATGGYPLVIQRTSATTPFSNTWYPITIFPTTGVLRSVSTLLDPAGSGAVFAVAVGDNGLVVYSQNAIFNGTGVGATWSQVPTISQFVYSGNTSALTNYNLVAVTIVDIQTILVTAVPTIYNSTTQTPGQSVELYLYVPGLFNSTANRVLDMYGNARASGTITASSFPTTSDYRIKTNPKDLDDAFTVDRLQPKTYFNEQTKKTEIGFLAHEVQEHYPFLVQGDKDDPDAHQTLNYQGIIGILVKEIQQLKSQIK